MLPKELIDNLEVFAESKTAKSLGFTNKSQLAAFAVREFLHRYSDYISVYELVDVTEDQVVMIDHDSGGVVKLNLKDGYLICDKHQKAGCDHSGFALVTPRVVSTLKNWKTNQIKDFMRKEVYGKRKSALKPS